MFYIYVYKRERERETESEREEERACVFVCVCKIYENMCAINVLFLPSVNTLTATMVIDDQSVWTSYNCKNCMKIDN